MANVARIIFMTKFTRTVRYSVVNGKNWKSELIRVTNVHGTIDGLNVHKQTL